MRLTQLLFLLLLLLFSCKQNQENKLVTSKNDSITCHIPSERTYSSCEELITEIVKSSNATAVKNFRDFKVRIENVNTEKITIELFIESDISENPSVKKIASQTVAWIEFFPLTQKLQDITKDIDNPEILKYDTSLLKKIDIKNCEQKNTFSGELQNNVNGFDELFDKKLSCKEEGGNMESGFITNCEVNSHIEESYKIFITESNIYDIKYLLPYLPKQSITINNDNVETEYLIKKNTVDINIFYQGGETTIKLTEKNNTKTSINIIHSPD